MDIQVILVLLIVFAAAVYAGRGVYSKTAGLFSKSKCGTDCGCGTNPGKRA